METLKMKFKLYALEFEVEGQQEIVKDEFRNFNDNILTQLLSKINISQSPTTVFENDQKQKDQQPGQNLPLLDDAIAYPILRDVKLRDLPKTESEWLLVYCFYASGFGQKEFTKDELYAHYEKTDRKTESRVKNFSNNIKFLVNSLFIKSTNETNFIILKKGIDKAADILNGNSASRPSHQRQTARKVSDNGDGIPTPKIDLAKSKEKPTPLKFVDLKFSIEEMKSIQAFFAEKKPKGQNDEVAVALLWYSENKHDGGATIEELSYLIKIATGKVPAALGQVLINMKGPKLNLLTKDDGGKFTLSSLGLLHVTNELSK